MKIGRVKAEKSGFKNIFLYNLAKWQPVFNMAAERKTLKVNTIRAFLDDLTFSYTTSQSK